MRLPVDAHSPIPVRQHLSEPLERAIQGGGGPRDPARPSIRERVGCFGSNPNPAARHRGSHAERIPAAPPWPRGA